MGHLCTPQVVECSISCPQNKWPSFSDASRDSALLLSRNWEFLKKTTFVHHGCFSHQHLKVSSSSSSSSPSSSFKSIVFCSNSESKPQQSRKQSSSNTTTSTNGDRKRAPKITDEALREDLQFFLSSQGLPLDKVPPTKELANRGREDLAKIVRRRGYKAINGLLNNDPKEGSSLTREEEINASPNSTNLDGLSITTNIDIEQSEQVVKSDDTDKWNNPLCVSQKSIDENQDGFLKTEIETSYSSNGSLMGSIVDESLLQRAAAEFVQIGHLDHSQVISDEEEEKEEEEEEEENNLYEDSSDEEENGETWNEARSSEAIAIEKAAKLRAKLLPFLKMSASKKSNDQSNELVKQQTMSQDLHMTNVGAPVSRLEIEIELQRIKSDLREKERELAEMSRELEEAKAQLALVQAKAAVEVAQAQQVVLEKDIRLRSADRALASLKHVQVEYWGEGSVVELAGSFNGWKHFVVMKPDLTSEISKPDGSRGQLMWETELWLYPGVYEIKFIVDGIWQIDERREIVMRDTLDNNILRVDP